MIGSDAVVVRREFLSRFSAGLLAISSILAIPSPFWASTAVLASPLTSHLAQQPTQSPKQSARAILPATNSSQDPLQSPFPLPWHLIDQQQTQAIKLNRSVLLKYATTPLRSPDGQVVAFSEIDVRISPDLRQSHIFSQLVVKTAQGKTLSVIPSSMHLSQSAVDETAARNIPGTVAILVPAAWSPDGQKLLSRQFEAVFGSDVSSDYAVIWDRNRQLTKTVSPLPLNYDSATLLGWNPKQPSQVLFNTTILGEKEGTVLAVDYRNNTVASPLSPNKPQSIQYGQALTAPRQ